MAVIDFAHLKECWKDGEIPEEIRLNKCEFCKERFSGEAGDWCKIDGDKLWICNYCYDDAVSETMAEKYDKEQNENTNN